MQVNEVPEGVRFYNHREKHVALLPPGSAARRQAKAVVMRGKDMPYRDIAARLGVGLSTVHRLIQRLALTLEVEAGKRDREIKAAARTLGSSSAHTPQAHARGYRRAG